ncbi:unnamed protein product [Phyllotreta striolata]|uniref:MoaB/Mog domain-containing protein n=1 Tax=Phyllotreta striolata TaxID=444603 RepID=A0A9N9TIJ8_PHYSR|nr:unnamed protein product [Phyllotreta striolata]
MPSPISFGILTVSDSSYAVNSKDLSGPKLKEEIFKEFPSAEITRIKIVPDDLHKIKATLTEWCDMKINIIFTTGGTGFSSRDVTPEATLAVVQKQAPGLTIAMITNSLKITPMAMLSRPGCGIRDTTLIINLPGSPKAVSECFGVIKEALPHAVELLTDQKDSVISTHGAVQSHSRASVVPTTSPSKVQLKAALRDRESRYPMMDIQVASEIINNICKNDKITTEMVPFESSLNRVLAEDIHASEPIPSFAASIKDGYAVKSSDGAGIRVVKKVAAAGDGPIDEVLQPGEAIRISTGAPIPAGADAVVQVEDTAVVECSIDGAEEIKVDIKRAPKPNDDIRAIGRDVATNSLVLNKGKCIKPFHLGVLAMLGKTNVEVYKRPSVGIISTGNELCEPGEQLAPGKIRDSNRYTLINLLKNYHYESNDCGIVKDKYLSKSDVFDPFFNAVIFSPDAVKQALEKSFTRNDVIITSGGVSMGEFDVLKRVLVEDFEATIHFARLNMKPGKPTTFATLMYNGERKMVFGLPGNPASCGVTCLLFVIPALRLMEQSIDNSFPFIEIPASKLKDGPYINNDNRPEFRRVKVNCDLSVTTTGDQISSRLNSLVGANGLLLLDPGAGAKTSDEFITILFDDLNVELME